MVAKLASVLVRDIPKTPVKHIVLRLMLFRVGVTVGAAIGGGVGGAAILALLTWWQVFTTQRPLMVPCYDG